MKHIAFGAVCATVLATMTIATAKADDTVQSGSSSIDDTIRALEDKGYQVIVRRAGSEPLRKCRVGAIRSGHGVTEQRPEAGTVPGTSVYLDLIC